MKKVRSPFSDIFVHLYQSADLCVKKKELPYTKPEFDQKFNDAGYSMVYLVKQHLTYRG